MYKALLKIRLKYILNSMFNIGRKKGKKQNPIIKILLAVLAVYVVGVMLGTFGVMFYGLGHAFIGTELQNLYFSIAGLLSFVFCFICSVFMCQKEIFDAKDNELLLSMPITPRAILASRLTTIILLNYIYSAFILIPSYAIWIYLAGFDFIQLLIFIVVFLIFPLLATAVSCLFGWLIELITSKMRSKNLFTLIFSFLFLGVYVYIYTNFINIANDLLSQGESFSKIISTYLPPIANMGNALANKNILDLLLLVVWCVVPFVLTCYILSKTFFRIITRKKGGAAAVYREKEAKVSGVMFALIKKELKRFFTLPVYILNCGLGCIFQVLLAGYLIFNRNGFDELFSGSFPIDIPIYPIIIAVLALCASMNNMTDCSISLEGRCINLLRSMPVKTMDVYNAKILTNIIVCTPSSLISAIIIRIIFPMNLYYTLMLFLVPAACQVFAAVWGLLANILLPRFEWINETVVVKQSISVLLGLLGGMAMIMLPIGIYFIALRSVLSIDMFVLVFLLLFVVMTSAMYVAISTYGKSKFESFSA